MPDNEKHPVIPKLTAARRRWVYGLTVAAAPIAVFYGVVTGEEAALWIAGVAAFLSGGVALPNVSGD